MTKTPFTKARCRVEFDYFLKGSVLKGTVNSGCTAMRTHFDVESSEPREKVLNLIRLAKQGCYAEKMVEAPVLVESTINLNGEAISLEGITE
jgi:hypothetical protein